MRSQDFFFSGRTMALSIKPQARTGRRRDAAVSLGEVVPTHEEELKVHAIIDNMDGKALHSKMSCLTSEPHVVPVM